MKSVRSYCFIIAIFCCADFIFCDICTMPFNRNNFHKRTFCIFRSAATPNRLPDHTSKSGSQYWFGQDGVFRNSNHWGRAAKCKWKLIGSPTPGTRTKCGFALWTDFSADDEVQKLYFIRIEHRKPDYFHKNADFFSNDFLRTSGDTTKRLRQIRQFLENSDGNVKNHSEILSLLVSTDLPMWKISATFQSSP